MHGEREDEAGGAPRLSGRPLRGGAAAVPSISACTPQAPQFRIRGITTARLEKLLTSRTAPKQNN
jgi:hypothetical protein